MADAGEVGGEFVVVGVCWRRGQGQGRTSRGRRRRITVEALLEILHDGGVAPAHALADHLLEEGLVIGTVEVSIVR
jgi:hypothetical protein